MHGTKRVKIRTVIIKIGEIKFLDEGNNVKSDSIFVSFAWRKVYILWSGHYVVNIGKYQIMNCGYIMNIRCFQNNSFGISGF